MLSTLASVSALLTSFCIICLGHSLNNTLLGVRATLEDFPAWVTGLMMSGYFVGFIVGTIVCNHLLPKVGQIRIFAAFASIASAISLAHILWIHPISWIALRLLYGMSIAALYMVIEGWLNALSSQGDRGRILSTYMIITFIGWTIGQGFFFLADAENFSLFATVSILISLALVPLTLSRGVTQPDAFNQETYSMKRLFAISSLASFGCIVTGLTTGAFWGMGAVYLTQIGLNPQDVALFIGTTFIGGLLLQWPIGWFSDIVNRRTAIMFTCGSATIVSILIIVLIGSHRTELSWLVLILALLFGGFTYTLYSLCIALANDFLESQYIVKSSGTLITMHAMGAIAGPIVAALFMSTMGPMGLFVFLAVTNGGLMAYSLHRMHSGRTIPESTTEDFVPLPRTSFAIANLDPRQDDKE